jgi:uncharacterized protein with FMN-binding domain
MRRAPIVLTGTVAGLAAVLSFKAREPSLPVVAAVPAPSGGTAAAGGTTASRGGSSSGTTTSRSSSASKASSATTRTATGDAIATRYGNVQVRVTVRGGKITKVEALQLTGNDPKSAEISAQAEPLLRQSALTKQSAAIDAVSGATISSAGYEASLQSALDKAGFKAADGTRGSSTIPNVQEDHGGPGGPPGFTGP